ncbi:hemerythrin domain-containing protein [Nisaea acidiphila]|uniref:Hemerythrin domain-containing protein n=1 Tax=Nisaea acidiphila TaxID=1862145 RepID=A0A9J7AU10_9PROT|nr:hemerythrin domain-containing protein [Nisaea acidiphila]UUX50314.1 hemerythrin domain-containing protein [Nisaea acidiphila]
MVAMPKILEILQKDHEQHDLLLSILEKQVKDAHLRGEPDYDVVSEIVDYFLTYPAEFHHVREDQIYEKILARDPQAAEEIGQIEEEHKACEAFIKAFAGALASVLGTGIVTRSQFANAALEFIESQRRHIRMEESIFFPTALRVLKQEDWRDLDDHLSDRADPIFGSQREAQFETLRQEILDWQSAREPANDRFPAGQEMSV